MTTTALGCCRDTSVQKAGDPPTRTTIRGEFAASSPRLAIAQGIRTTPTVSFSGVAHTANWICWVPQGTRGRYEIVPNPIGTSCGRCPHRQPLHDCQCHPSSPGSRFVGDKSHNPCQTRLPSSPSCPIVSLHNSTGLWCRHSCLTCLVVQTFLSALPGGADIPVCPACVGGVVRGVCRR